MKLIIPMTGAGRRFLEAGYTKPKFLLQVDGKPVIEHVLDSFPGEEDVIFICHPEHLANTDTEAVLRSLKPQARIVVSDGVRKGPVHAVQEAFAHIPDDEPALVTYCDYGQVWDYPQFLKDIARLECDGAVPAYTGFHPHLLHKNLYAGILVDDTHMATAIKEKHCFTEQPEDSYHSPGSYYFKSGTLLKKYLKEIVESVTPINGEHYVSMAYELMLRDGLKIFVPELTHFMQWGTPEDFEEYEAWSRRIHQETGYKKMPTDIPESRIERIVIPHPEHSPEFRKGYKYWKKYFDSK